MQYSVSSSSNPILPHISRVLDFVFIIRSRTSIEREGVICRSAKPTVCNYWENKLRVEAGRRKRTQGYRSEPFVLIFRTLSEIRRRRRIDNSYNLFENTRKENIYIYSVFSYTPHTNLGCVLRYTDWGLLAAVDKIRRRRRRRKLITTRRR